MVQFGLAFDFRNPAQWRVPWDTLYRNGLDQIAYAEELGFDYVWLGEHHFTEDGRSPAGLTVAAAVAARTKRIRIGTMVLLLPLWNAVRVAEDAATVDLISGGRLVLGVGQGYRRVEFEGLGIPLHERLPRFLEGFEVIRRAWENPSVTFHGRFYHMDDVKVTPPPLQKPRPEIWFGASTEGAARRTARLADGFMAANKLRLMQVYRDALREFRGSQAKPRISRTVVMYVAEDPDREWAHLKGQFLYRHQQYYRWLTEAGLTNPQWTPLGDIRDADQLRKLDPIFFCDVDAAVRLVRSYLQEEGVVELSFLMGVPGADPARVVRSMELFARKVMPHFRGASESLLRKSS